MAKAIMSADLEAWFETLEKWCSGKRMKRRDGLVIGPEDMRADLFAQLQHFDKYDSDLRIAEVLLAFDYWARQPGIKARLYPAGKRLGFHNAKMWFGYRVQFILGRDDEPLDEGGFRE